MPLLQLIYNAGIRTELLPPIIFLGVGALTDFRREREITLPQERPVSQAAVILFPITIAVFASLAVPAAAPLIGMLMFGNLLRESGVTERLSKTASGPLINIVTIVWAWSSARP